MLRSVVLAIVLLLPACGTPRVEDQLANIRRWEDHRLSSATDSLAISLREGPPSIRQAAARALGRIGHPAGRPALETALREDRRAEVRGEAAFALGILGDPTATRSLVSRIAHETDAWALGEIALALGRIGETGAVPHLLPLVEKGHPHVREQAVESLALLADSTSVQTLLAATDDPLEPLRWRAAYALEKIPGETQVPRLRELTRDRSSLVRRYAIRSLGRLGATAATGDIVDALEQAGNDWQVRVMACDALGRLGGNRAIAALTGQLGHPSFQVRVAALQGLGRVKARSEIHLILDATDDPVVDVRVAAYTAVADCLEGRAYANLSEGVLDPSPLVASRCLARLGESVNPAVVPMLLQAVDNDERPALRAAAMDGLGRTGDRAPLSRIETGLRDEDWMVATMAAQALGQLVSTRSVDALLAAYPIWDARDNADVCQAILVSLGELQDRKATGLLREVLMESTDRWRRSAALTGLAKLVPEAEAASLPTEDDLRWDVRPVRRSPRQPALVTRSTARQLILDTAKGRIVLDLFGEDAPQMVENFARLASSGFFDGLSFHRVVPNFVIQGGDPLGTGWGDAGYRIRSEWNPRRFERGMLGIAHSGKDTGSCQLFITMSPQPHLNARYTVFGHVVQGMDVVERIEMGDEFSAEVRWPEPGR